MKTIPEVKCELCPVLTGSGGGSVGPSMREVQARALVLGAERERSGAPLALCPTCRGVIEVAELDAAKRRKPPGYATEAAVIARDGSRRDVSICAGDKPEEIGARIVQAVDNPASFQLSTVRCGACGNYADKVTAPAAPSRVRVYVVMAIDNAKKTVVGVGIYSSPWGSLTLPVGRLERSYADVMSADGEDFEAAEKNAIVALKMTPCTRWMADWIENKSGESVAG